MQVTSNMASPALAPPMASSSSATAMPAIGTILTSSVQPLPVMSQTFEAPDNADPQSVVQAQIEEAGPPLNLKEDADTARIKEQQAEAAARTKSIMGMLPANPSEVTKLMSALAAATSAEAIADIKLDAQPV